MALFAKVHAERFDKGTFTCAGHASDAHADRVASVGNQLPQYFLTHIEMRLGIAFHQSDGLSEDIAITSQYPGYVFIHGQAAAARGVLARRCHACLTKDAVVAAIDSSHHGCGEFLTGIFGNPVGFVMFFGHGQNRRTLGFGEKKAIISS